LRSFGREVHVEESEAFVNAVRRVTVAAREQSRLAEPETIR
jgi:hypothetical protein